MPQVTGSAPPRDAERPLPRRWRRRVFARIVLPVPVLVVALVGALTVWLLRSGDDDAWEPTSAEQLQAAEDALHRRVVAELRVFRNWLEENDAEGYVGEIGIPNDEDADRWRLLAQRWFAEADRSGLWVDVWSAGEWWGLNYHYSVFEPRTDGEPLARTTSTGELLSWYARNSDEPRGVNVSGAEFGAPGSTEGVTEFSNESPGEHGADYRYESQATFDYVASQGMDSVRLPFRWERIQPELGGALDRAELGRLRDAVGRAAAAGLEVILDVHNYGAYHLSDGTQGVRRAIGSPEVSVDDFADLWRRLSAAFADNPVVVAYDLMNEPANLPTIDGRSSAQVWEEASQSALDAIRAAGDEKLVMVAGYQYSHARDWAEQHPQDWIEDPADNIRYAAHHYWQRDETNSYDVELANAAEAGY